MRFANLAIAVAAVAGPVAACSSGPSQAELDEWCPQMEDAYVGVTEDIPDVGATGDLEGMVADLEDRMSNVEETFRSAPEDVRDKFLEYLELDAESLRLSDQERLDELQTELTEYVQKHCDLAIEM